MILILLLNASLFLDPGVNITPYNALLLSGCADRIDIVNRTNARYDGYAWYKPRRIIIYDGNMHSNERRREVLAHELGHLCAEKYRRNTSNYAHNERVADEIAKELLRKVTQ